MSTAAPSPITNPGRSENVQRQASLADAIAANLTAGRQEAEAATAPEQAKPAPKPKPEREVAPLAEVTELERRELGEPEHEADGEVAAPEEQASDEAPEPYSLADFADAAELDVDTLVGRLEVEVNRDGEKARVSLKEVLDGYRWNAANTQRAQELADQRRQVEQRLAEVSTMHDQAEAVVRVQWADVEAEEQALQQQYHAMPWEQLRLQGGGAFADAEAQFSRRRNEIEQRKQRLAGAYQRVQQERQALVQRQQTESVPREQARLRELVPEWSDSDVAAREGNELVRHVVDRYGFDEADVRNITDARIVAALHRLWKLEAQATGVPLAKKRADKAPKPYKPGQRASKQDKNAKKRDALRSKLKRSGKRDDLAAIVLNNLRGE